jgi:hypothetical protein
MAKFRATDVFDEIAELLAQGSQDLVFVFNGLCN